MNVSQAWVCQAAGKLLQLCVIQHSFVGRVEAVHYAAHVSADDVPQLITVRSVEKVPHSITLIFRKSCFCNHLWKCQLVKVHIIR